jgi:hypothetical protein
LFDQIIENNALIQALEDRQRAKDRRDRPAGERAKFQEADERARAQIAELALEPGTMVRAGRFRLRTTEVDPAHVEFDRSGRVQTTISML